MERRLFFIMTLGALLAVLCGAAMIVAAPGYLTLGWMRAKLLLVAALIGYHGCCYHLMRVLRAGGSSHSQRWYRLFNELPGVLLVAIVVLAGGKSGGPPPPGEGRASLPDARPGLRPEGKRRAPPYG